MAITKNKLEFAEFIEKIEAIKGRHTELVTVLIPADYNVNMVVHQLEGEKSTANNIKSRATRNAVIESLEKVIRELKLGPQKYPNGIAIYCGNVSEQEGVPDIQFFSIEPPEQLRTRTYRCDQEFVIEPLKEMTEVKEVYGLLVIERKEATIGLLEGTQIKVLQKMSSGVPGKIRAGGQSSQRFARVTEGLAKEEFLEEGQLVTALKNKVIGVKDIGYADEHGLKLLVEASKDVLAEQAITIEKKILENFFNTLGKHPDKATYGYDKIKKALELGAVQTLILSENIPREQMKELSKKADEMGTEVITVSNKTGEGEQFLNLCGMGALLRYAANLGD